jgi:hypothetical protein
MKRFPLLLLLLLPWLACDTPESQPAQGATDLLEAIDPEIKDLPDIDERIYFAGKIDEYPVVMQLDLKDDSVMGKYRYTNQEEFLALRGYLDSDEKIVIQEFTSEGNHTGTFRGYSGFRSRFVGDWVKADNTGSLLFELRPTEVVLFRPSSYIPSEKLSVEVRHVQRVAADSSCFINIYYPVLGGLEEEIAASINEKLKGPADSALNQQLEGCKGDEFTRENQLPASSIEESFVLSGIKGPVLSLTQDYYAYFSGAAHGNYGSSTTNFDLPQRQGPHSPMICSKPDTTPCSTGSLTKGCSGLTPTVMAYLNLRG